MVQYSDNLPQNSAEEWRELSHSVYRATRETKIQSLQFGIMNRFFPCNAFLKQIRVKDSASCDRCDAEDSLLHFFYACPEVEIFRRAVFDWLNRVEELHLENITAKQFLFGVTKLRLKVK